MATNPFISPYGTGQRLFRRQHFTHLGQAAKCSPGDTYIAWEHKPAGYIIDKMSPLYKGTRSIQGLASLPALVLAGYHGYGRNDGDIPLTIGWALLGLLFPFMTTGIVLAQGIGKKG